MVCEIKSKSRCTSWNGYRPGHPWFYVRGGAVLMPKEILADVKSSGYQGYMADTIAKADNKPEPQRSETLRKIKTNVFNHFWADLSCYRGVVRELRSYRRRLGALNTPDKCEAVHESVSLKHNHLYNDCAHLVRLDELLSRQPDLFGD